MKTIKILDGSVEVSVDFILDNSYSDQDDLVIVTSSLVEGIGNKYSDLDVYVFKSDLPKVSDINLDKHHRVLTVNRTIATTENFEEIKDDEVLLVHTVIPDTDIKVDVEFKTFSSIEETAKKLDDLFNYSINNLEMLSKYLEERENSIIHRIYEAIPINNKKIYERIKSMFTKSRYCYICYRWLASDFSILLDIFGALSKQEYDRAIEMSQKNLKNQIQALLHIKGCTNVDPKWMYTYLKCSSDKEIKSIHDDYFRFIYFVDYDLSSNTEKRRYVLDSLDFCDRIFDLTVPILEDYPETPGNKESEALLLERYDTLDDEGESYENREYEYRRRVYSEGKELTRRWVP